MFFFCPSWKLNVDSSTINFFISLNVQMYHCIIMIGTNHYSSVLSQLSIANSMMMMVQVVFYRTQVDSLALCSIIILCNQNKSQI